MESWLIILIIFVALIIAALGFILFKKYFLNNLESEKDTSSNKASTSNPIIMFLGGIGAGKTRLYKQLCGNQKTINETCHQQFVHADFNDYNITVADTPSLDLDGGIDAREETILKYQEYFKQFNQRIAVFCIIVGFERTDLMKKRILDILKYFQKFSQNTIIIVTNWQLSEDPQKDKEGLEKDLKAMKARKILFVKFMDNPDAILSQFSMLDLIIPKNIDLQDTIFEPPDLQFNQQMNNQLNQIALAVNKKQGEQLSVFSKELKEQLIQW